MKTTALKKTYPTYAKAVQAAQRYMDKNWPTSYDVQQNPDGTWYVFRCQPGL